MELAECSDDLITSVSIPEILDSVYSKIFSANQRYLFGTDSNAFSRSNWKNHWINIFVAQVIKCSEDTNYCLIITYTILQDKQSSRIM